MTGDPVLVEAVDVDRAPGFEDGGPSVADLSSGITIVHGPNASGKTTLARSIQGLIWPEQTGERTSLTGQLSLDGDQWRVEVHPGGVRYQRNGQETNGPTLPPADQRDRYHLALHDLLQRDTRNESFARTIERESAGGYDLAAAHEALGFDDSPSTRGKSVVQEAEAALADRRDAKDDVRTLRTEQTRLDTLRSDLEEARAARERVTLLDQAIEYAEARAERETARATVDEFPDVLSDIDGDEADRVDDIESRIEESKDEKEAAEVTRSEAEVDLAAANLPDDGVRNGTIARLEELRDDLDSLEDRKRQLEADMRDAEAQRENALSDVPLELDDDELVDLEPGVWSDVSEFAREANRVRADRAMQDAVDRWLGGDDRPDTDLSTVKRGRNGLENWLASSPAGRDDGGETAFRIAVASAVLLAVAGGLLAVLVHPALGLFAVLGAGVGWYGYRARDPSGSIDPRATHRETFERRGIEAPTEWSETGVRDRLNELYDAIAAHRVAERREQIRETLSTDVDNLEAREQSLDERRAALRDRLGTAPEAADVQILAIVKGILRWQESDDRVVGLRAEIERVEEQLETTRSELRDALEPYGYDDVSDAPRATEHIRDLEHRQSTHESAERKIERAEETIEEATETIAELVTEREAMYEKAGLSPGEYDQLHDLCERVEDYRGALEDCNNAEYLADNERTDLEDHPGHEPELEEQSVRDLRQERRSLEERAEECEELGREITEIETKIEEAKRSNDVEAALAETERALDAVADQLVEDYDSLVGHVLTEHVRESTQESSRPEVFRRAGDVLARITNDRYRLDLDDDADTFRAYDTVTEKGYALDELSSATRLQVLLSVRVAFVEHHEQGVRLPLVLDETLANTDDGKADVVIESMVELARDGRQVIYFTAQGDEVARWRSALEAVETVEHTLVDLADTGDIDGHVDVPDLEDIPDHARAPPAPDDHDLDSYRDELDVPRFDPRRGAGRAHLWYVIDDVDLLARLLDLGYERWGQLETLLDRTDGGVIADDPEVVAAIERNGAALRSFVRAWQRGRGDRVDRGVLQASGAVSETFIDDVTELAEQYDGDGARIIAGLRASEVDRFRTGKTDELEQYLEENGHIEPVDPLDPEEIRARVVETFLANDVPRERALDRADQLLSRLAHSSSRS